MNAEDIPITFKKNIASLGKTEGSTSSNPTWATGSHPPHRDDKMAAP